MLRDSAKSVSPIEGPNLIIIGAQKCGTTSLHRYLDVHPSISMHTLKETNFFLSADLTESELAKYVASFDPAPIRGESCPNYTNLPKSSGTAERIRALVPHARLIYLVRDPVERLVSQYTHYRAAGVEHRPIGEAMRDTNSSYLSRSRYGLQLQPFLTAFSRQQIRIVSTEELLHNRIATIQSLFAFLGVATDVESGEFQRLWEQSAGKGRLYALLWPVAAWARDHGLTAPRALKWPIQRALRGRRRDPRAPEAQAFPVRSHFTSDELHLVHDQLAEDVADFCSMGDDCAAAHENWRTWAELAATCQPQR